MISVYEHKNKKMINRTTHETTMIERCILRWRFYKVYGRGDSLKCLLLNRQLIQLH